MLIGYDNRCIVLEMVHFELQIDLHVQSQSGQYDPYSENYEF